ncbi:hypothetical protein D1869_04110 [Sulfurisphaera ohwakuensis]|uniref:Uncharacterized protein n=1 Tax=Sulfurisphaera ohwakuensis TaxID=69656 RepID=A0A650CFF3_SULOH|nr:hypothetical protein [Sulfurisphaera ohwakuensis]MBB5255252.1 hypothetical protein [Sulfurisphaera ohwakuensis]QGR16476.1 hypothetical protein D1869_04110 [Sulfurisphaera ohwakuensis]
MKKKLICPRLPSSKYDKNITNSIELMPKWFKDMLFSETIIHGEIDNDIVERVIKRLEGVK